MPFRLFPPTREANIRVVGKTVPIVFTYLSGIPALEMGVGGSNAFPPRHHPISQLIAGYLFKDDVTVILLLGVSFMLP
jgi:hypothetical protein